MKRIMIYMDDELYSRIRKISRETNQSISDVTRMLIKAGLSCYIEYLSKIMNR